MACERLLEQRTRNFVKCLRVITMIFFVASSCAAQAPAASPSPNNIWLQYMNKYPGLLEEFGRLFEKLSHDLQYPLPRNESRLLQLLPDSTVYLAFPNYGDVTHQDIFHQELQGSAALRNWWQHSEVAATGPKVPQRNHGLYTGGATLAGTTPYIVPNTQTLPTQEVGSVVRQSGACSS
jgi:hypothetical protein